MSFVIGDRVKETTATVGYDNLVLLGAPTGYRRFNYHCSIGNTLFYTLVAVDGSGAPTGQWECGIATYVAANTLERTNVFDSSGGNNGADLAAGTKEVFLSLSAQQLYWLRERLEASRTYYVAANGSPYNNGLTSDKPVNSLQRAIDLVATLDMGGNQVTIQMADGSYAGLVETRPYLGSNAPIIQGNYATPANVLIGVTGDTFTHTTAMRQTWELRDLKIQSDASGVVCVGAGNVVKFRNVEFGACTTAHISAQGGSVEADGNYKISGAAGKHALVSRGGEIKISAVTATITASVAIGTFADASSGARIDASGSTFSLGANTVTGVRYSAASNALILTNGAGASFLPGTSAGSTATGGQYL